MKALVTKRWWNAIRGNLQTVTQTNGKDPLEEIINEELILVTIQGQVVEDNKDTWRKTK